MKRKHLAEIVTKTRNHLDHFKQLQDMVRYHLAGKSCVDCGLSRPQSVLQFDHVRGKKHFAISEAIWRNVTVKALEAELEKCDVRCANCHFARHRDFLVYLTAEHAEAVAKHIAKRDIAKQTRTWQRSIGATYRK